MNTGVALAVERLKRDALRAAAECARDPRRMQVAYVEEYVAFLFAQADRMARELD